MDKLLDQHKRLNFLAYKNEFLAFSTRLAEVYDNLDQIRSEPTMDISDKKWEAMPKDQPKFWGYDPLPRRKASNKCITNLLINVSNCGHKKQWHTEGDL